jgi:hypothetical protein
MNNEESVKTMTSIVARFTDYAGKHLPDDIMGKLRELREAEDSPLAKVVYDSMFDNLAKAAALNRPCCQDTGVIQYYIKAGSDFPLLADVKNIRPRPPSPRLRPRPCATTRWRSLKRKTPAPSTRLCFRMETS